MTERVLGQIHPMWTALSEDGRNFAKRQFYIRLKTPPSRETKTPTPSSKEEHNNAPQCQYTALDIVPNDDEGDESNVEDRDDDVTPTDEVEKNDEDDEEI